MVTKRVAVRVGAGLALWAGAGGAASAQLPQVTPEWACRVMPKQKGVNVSTPTPDQVPNCKVTPIPKAGPNAPTGFVVRDPAGNPVRQFVSYDGKAFHIQAFYVDGVEAYRELFPPQTTDPHHYRWLGPNGAKWGLDKDKDGTIDEWVVISPEELSQELLQAVLDKNPKRAEALVLTKANLDALGVGGKRADDLLARAAKAAQKVAEAGAALKAAPDAKWVHLELGVPHAEPADVLGARDDLIIHKGGTVLVQDGKDGKSFQTGELVQVGRAWKLVDGPSAGAAAVADAGGPPVPEAIRELVAKLHKIDETAPKDHGPAVAAYYARRVEVLEQIHAKLPDEAWTKQLIDSLAAAGEGEKADGKHVARLKQFKDAFAGKPGPVGAYAWFRHLVTENAIALATADGTKFQAVQEEWRKNLEAFVAAHPKADDAPEAILRLGMAHEFLGTKDGEAQAKKWYGRLAADHAGHPHAAKAAGAVRRLDSEGQPLAVAGPTLTDGKQFTAAALNGKAVVVYYFAAWGSTLAEDAKKLKALAKEYGKGLEVVAVCLDGDSKTAAATVAAHGLPGTVLFAPGGLDGSPLAAQYGVLVVPHILVAGKDGKVVNRSAQAANLEDEVKKLLP
jgi:peroxiredoxin